MISKDGINIATINYEVSYEKERSEATLKKRMTYGLPLGDLNNFYIDDVFESGEYKFSQVPDTLSTVQESFMRSLELTPLGEFSYQHPWLTGMLPLERTPVLPRLPLIMPTVKAVQESYNLPIKVHEALSQPSDNEELLKHLFGKYLHK